MAYPLSIFLGVVLAYGVRRALPPPAYPQSRAIAAVALVGALAGALLFELPADWLGWTAPSGQAIRVHAFGGRTVLGGILGGWLAVEAAKPALGVRVPTGDGFAAPLAVALACGRVGCLVTGCCAGRVVAPGSWWGPIAIAGVDGAPRFPAPLVEIVFHAAAAVALVVAARRGWLAGRALAAYVAAYAVVRALLEEVRENPPVLGPLTYYQILVVPLFVLAAGTFVMRTRANDAH
jgi:phosphatidylglycerol---prolipoprotein diacylglyceryl transferase